MNNAPTTTAQQVEYRDEYIEVDRDEDGAILSVEVTYGFLLLTFDGFQSDAVCAFASDRDGNDIKPFRITGDAEVDAFEAATHEVVRPAAEAGIIGADVLTFWEDC
jgi:hypothetical protein